MLHRFDSGNGYQSEHTYEQLVQHLECLRKKKFNFMSLDELFGYLYAGKPLPGKTVCFTVDDGYFDQLEVSVPAFAKYDCSATYFVVTDFIDRKIWMWDSKIHYIHSSVDQVTFDRFSECIPSLSGRKNLSQRDVIFTLTDMPLSKIHAVIRTFLSLVNVNIPELPVDDYRSCTWRDLENAVKQNMMVGAHTLEHPLLSQESEEESRRQILGSYDRLVEKLGLVSKVFCYPVGRTADFGEKDCRIARNSGFVGAVSAEPGVASIDSNYYSVPRYALPSDKMNLIQYASWIESAKERFRGLRSHPMASSE